MTIKDGRHRLLRGDAGVADPDRDAVPQLPVSLGTRVLSETLLPTRTAGQFPEPPPCAEATAATERGHVAHAG